MKLPFNPGKTGYYVAGFVLVCILAWLTTCHDAKADGIAVSTGSTVLRGPAGALQVEWQWPAFEGRDSHWETGITMIGPSTYGFHDVARTVWNEKLQLATTVIDHIPTELNNTFAWDATFVDGFGPVDIGIGPAYLQNSDAYNHEGANFHLMLGYHWHRWFIRYNHFSNAGSKAPNLGRDLLLAGAVL